MADGLDARCCLHTTTPREPLCRLLPQVRQNLGVHAEPTTCLNRPTGEGAKPVEWSADLLFDRPKIGVL